jgi:hypothetical protein
VLKDPADNQYLKGEYFGYFLNRLVKRFMRQPFQGPSFNSTFFNVNKLKMLDASVEAISVAFNTNDVLNAAGEINYVVTAILWGFLGDSEWFTSANYGMRAYMTGIIQKIYASVESPNSGSQADAAMSFRRHLIVRGVLQDVLSETYRLKTGTYEDCKMLENGSIWEEGKLV